MWICEGGGRTCFLCGSKLKGALVPQRQGHCFVPGCSTGYRSHTNKLSLFGVPKETARVQWRRAVTHANKHLKDNSAACKLHFPEGCISRRCGRRSCLNRQGPARVAPGSSAHAVLHKVPGEATSPEREAHPQPHPANKAQRMLAHLRV